MILIRNAHLYTMVPGAEVIEGGDVLVDQGKIVRTGVNLTDSADTVIDATGKYVMPGIVDAHCHIGMWEDSVGQAGADGNEVTNPVTPELRAIDAINPADYCFTEAVEAGVTCACTGPGSANVIGGQFVAMKTSGKYVDEMVFRSPLAMKSAFGENPKRCYGESNKTPQTRMATAAIFRQALVGAQEYMEKMRDEDPAKRPARDLGKEALAQVLRGELVLKMHAHRADDIMTALRLVREFHLNASIEHCTEGYLILDALKKAGVGCILGPLLGERSKIELSNKTFRAPYEFFRAGVKFALMTDHPVIPIQYLPVQAGLCVREGLPELEAFKAITIHAAEITGIADRVGSLAAGKDADIAVFDANPLETRTHATHVLVNGKVVYER